MVNDLHGKLLPKLLGKVAAEMHWRIAYAVCCLLMVLIGAAMGLILRGGQILAAMAISAVPAALVIVLLLAGKELIHNPKVTWGYVLGVAIIWGGVGLMAAAVGYLYAVPMRR
jgi:lipopolysaccharide export LptBFGC system permease protein LptF